MAEQDAGAAGGGDWCAGLPAARLVVRGREPAIAAAGAAFGVAMPRTPCRAAVAGERAALWLGPDEWLLLAPEGEGAAIEADLRAALAGLAHALADVSQRQVALAVVGESAEVLLAAGCPLDLRAASFPVGGCMRTLFGRAEVVLWRVVEHGFRMEVARSFAGYARGLLETARRDGEPTGGG